jgi:hypothetical protein
VKKIVIFFDRPNSYALVRIRNLLQTWWIKYLVVGSCGKNILLKYNFILYKSFFVMFCRDWGNSTKHDDKSPLTTSDTIPLNAWFFLLPWQATDTFWHTHDKIKDQKCLIMTTQSHIFIILKWFKNCTDLYIQLCILAQWKTYWYIIIRNNNILFRVFNII